MIATLQIPALQPPASKPLRWRCGWQSADLAMRRNGGELDGMDSKPRNTNAEWSEGWDARVSFERAFLGQ